MLHEKAVEERRHDLRDGHRLEFVSAEAIHLVSSQSEVTIRGDHLAVALRVG